MKGPTIIDPYIQVLIKILSVHATKPSTESHFSLIQAHYFR